MPRDRDHSHGHRRSSRSHQPQSDEVPPDLNFDPNFFEFMADDTPVDPYLEQYTTPAAYASTPAYSQGNPSQGL